MGLISGFRTYLILIGSFFCASFLLWLAVLEALRIFAPQHSFYWVANASSANLVTAFVVSLIWVLVYSVARIIIGDRFPVVVSCTFVVLVVLPFTATVSPKQGNLTLIVQNTGTLFQDGQPTENLVLSSLFTAVISAAILVAGIAVSKRFSSNS